MFIGLSSRSHHQGGTDDDDDAVTVNLRHFMIEGVALEGKGGTQRYSVNVPPLFTVFTFVQGVYLCLRCLTTVKTVNKGKHRKQR